MENMTEQLNRLEQMNNFSKINIKLLEIELLLIELKIKRLDEK